MFAIPFDFAGTSSALYFGRPIAHHSLANTLGALYAPRP
jgi:hypothetical protein